MGRTLVVLAVAYLSLITGPQLTDAGIPATITRLLECCPSMPILVNKASVNACMPTIEKRAGFHMFGGSAEKTRNCVLECAFKAENLLMTMANGSLTVNLTAVDAKLGINATSKWQNVLSGVKINCTATAPVPSKRSIKQQCTSGAHEVSLCAYKYMMTLCPEKIETNDCMKRLSEFPLTQLEKLKNKLKKKTTTAAAEVTETTVTTANGTETTTTAGTTAANTTVTTTDKQPPGHTSG